MNTAPVNPIEVDTELSDLHVSYATVERRIRRLLDSLHRAVNDTKDHGFWRMDDGEAVLAAAAKAEEVRVEKSWVARDIEKELASLDTYTADANDLKQQMRPLNALWAEHRWTRFFLATSNNGHVHSSMDCPTCNREGKPTEFAWQPHMSGKTETEAVAEYGMIMCTVCFPTAPADPAFKLEPRAKREAREAREAAKAQREATKAAKAITNPDGTPLKLTGRFGYTINTLVTAQRELAAKLFDAGFYPQLPGYAGYDTTADLADTDLLVAAIAHKTDRPSHEIRAEAQAKADKKIAKELKGVKK